MSLREFRRFLVFLMLILAAVGIASGAQCDHDFEWVEEPATCTEPGCQGYRCKICFIMRQMENVPQLGHDYTQWEMVREATCSADGLQTRKCRRCGYEDENILEALPHTFTATVKTPTCKTDGYTILNCRVCGYETKTDRVSAPGHQYIVTIHSPSCTEQGYTRYRCSVCSDTFYADWVEPNGHDYDTGVLTKAPTAKSTGTLTHTCSECGDSYTERIPTWDGSLKDVPIGAYYFAPVVWAVDLGVTQGVDRTHFGPDEICTRAQVVTFLWREAGEPKPQSGKNPFADVPGGAYYRNAVIWAVEQGITMGVDASHFGPDEACTRCQVVTFLHRARGCETAKKSITFTDVKAEDYFYEPVRWACQMKITVGTGGGAFSPYAPCTRARIVTFLFRAKDV